MKFLLFLSPILLGVFLLGWHYTTRKDTFFPSRDHFSQLIAQDILNAFSEEGVEFISVFKRGMEDCENGTVPCSFQEYVNLMLDHASAKAKWESTSLDSDFAEYQAIQRKVAYQYGIRTWDHLRYGKDWYSLSEICKYLSVGRSDSSICPGKEDAILTHLHWHLYHKKQNSLPSNHPCLRQGT